MTIFENFLRISGQSDPSLDLFLNFFTVMAPLNPTNEIIRQVWVGAGSHGDGVVGGVGHGQSLHCHVVRILTGTIRVLVALSNRQWSIDAM